ncbi:MAG: hypothetical protein U1F37_23005 [Alphaproteobacteria bacterium]
MYAAARLAMIDANEAGAGAKRNGERSLEACKHAAAGDIPSQIALL